MMLKKISIGLLASTLLVQGVSAQEESNATQMSFSDLIAQAEYSINNNESAAAIPILREIINRAITLDDRKAKESVQMARLQLGSSYSQLQKWSEASRYTKEYLANEPIKDRMAALQILGQVSMAQENWKELKFCSEEMLRENLAIKKKVVAEQFLLQALYNLGDYDEAIAMLPDVIAHTKNPATIRTYRIMQVRCLFETGSMDDLVAALPVLFRGETREDITLNLTLLRIGDQLFDRQDYRMALAMYRLVMSKAGLLNKHKSRLGSFEVTAETEPDKVLEFEQLRQSLTDLQKVPDYDVHISYRAAQIYSEQKRYWEAVVLFDQLYKKNPKGEQGMASYFQKLLLLFEMGAEDEAVAASESFMEKNNSGLYTRLICTRLAQQYLNKQEMKKALALGPRFADHWTRATDEDELAQETDLRYMFSFAHFQLTEYEEAIQSFDKVIALSPDSQAATDSNYWKAMCRLLQQDYELAYKQFMTYRTKWPRASFAPAALFRAGVCRFGLEDYEGAKEIFKTFIADYPKDAQMPEALSMYADLLAADGLIDEALENYDRAVKIIEEKYPRTDDPVLRKQMVAPATYAVIQAAQALKADAQAHAQEGEKESAKAKYQSIITWMERYMNSFGENANWAQGVFWVGKAQIELGEPEKAVKAYLDTVIENGTDPSQEGVTSILYDLAGIIRNRLPRKQFDPTVASIKQSRNRAKSETLKIRLDVLLGELEGTQEQLGNRLLNTVKKLDSVPPSGLGLMCTAQVAKKSYARSEEFYDHFTAHYEDSPFRVASYELRAKDLYQQKKLDEAYDLAVGALGMYGATEGTGWAQLMKGKIELERKEYAAAVETLNMIFSMRAWRGPISAEGMFCMAQAWEAQGNIEKAFAFYQRTYLLFKAYDGGKWAAEGYLSSARCLRKLGRDSASRNTYRAMLLDEYVRDLPRANVAKESLGPVETAELLSGSTNTMEIVTFEVSK